MSKSQASNCIMYVVCANGYFSYAIRFKFGWKTEEVKKSRAKQKQITKVIFNL